MIDAVDSDTSMPLALRLLDGVFKGPLKETVHTGMRQAAPPTRETNAGNKHKERLDKAEDGMNQSGPGSRRRARRPGPAAAASGTTRRGRRSPAARGLMETPGTGVPAPGAAAGIGDGATAPSIRPSARRARAARARPARTLQ